MSGNEIGTDELAVEFEIMEGVGAYVRGQIAADRLRQLQARVEELEEVSENADLAATNFHDLYVKEYTRADVLEQALIGIVSDDPDGIGMASRAASQALAKHGRKKD